MLLLGFCLIICGCPEKESVVVVDPGPGEASLRFELCLDTLDGRPLVSIFSETNSWQTAFYLDAGRNPIIPERTSTGLPVLFRDQTGTRYDFWGAATGGGNDGILLEPVAAGTAFFRTCAGMFHPLPLNGRTTGAADNFEPVNDRAWSIPVNSVVAGSAPDVIRSIENPTFTTLRAGTESTYLEADDWVVGVVIEGNARAYPGTVLIRREIVNDRIGAQAISVTHSPLSGSARVYALPDEVSALGVSGRVWNANMLMFDRSRPDNLFSQITGFCVRGPLRGHQLEPLPYFRGPWRIWRRLYPRTELLVPPDNFDHAAARRLEFSIEGGPAPPPFPVDRTDDRLPGKTPVFCVTNGLEARAYLR